MDRKMNVLITGISGQDGTILAMNLVRGGHKVVGLSRGGSSNFLNLELLRHSGIEVFSVSQERLSGPFLENILRAQAISVIVNFWGMSSVGASFSNPSIAFTSNFCFSLNILDLIRERAPEVHFINAVSSEMFGNVSVACSEISPLNPVSPYGFSKAFSFQMASMYRSLYGLRVSNAIFFNHESPLRHETFVTSKIVSGAYDIYVGKKTHLELGNLAVSRDWGWAPDYMQGIDLLASSESYNDVVFATGKSFGLKEFVCAVFNYFELNMENHLTSSIDFLRPSDISWNCGDYGTASALLGWKPSVDFNGMIEKLCRSRVARSASSDGDFVKFLSHVLLYSR
jgi:GDPmannose 4,6-dehydratase